jgi:hypothetical protein
MTLKVRALFVSVLAATLGLGGCGHYVCGHTFGNATCSSSGSGFSSGSGSSTPTAYLYAVDEVGTIDGYAYNSSASTFAAISPYTAPAIPPDLPGTGMVVAQKQYLYTAFATLGQIYGWSINSSGELTAISGSPFSVSYLVGNPEAGTWGMITNPAGTLLFVADTSGESIYVYSIGSGGVLTQVSGAPFSVPFFPGNLGTDGLGKYLYVTQEVSSQEVAAYTIGSSGTLTAVPGSPFTAPLGQVQGDASGDFLIGIPNDSADAVGLYVYSITQSGTAAGAITAVSGSPFSTTYMPTSFVVQPESGGNQVYTFGLNATDTAYSAVEGFTLSSTGTLTQDEGSPFTGVGNGSWGQIDQSGSYVFVYAGYDYSSNESESLVSPLVVGSGGALTQPVSTLTLTTPGYWVVTDTN